jgi:hypothetical protein
LEVCGYEKNAVWGDSGGGTLKELLVLLHQQEKQAKALILVKFIYVCIVR